MHAAWWSDIYSNIGKRADSLTLASHARNPTPVLRAGVKLLSTVKSTRCYTGVLRVSH